MRCFAFDLGRVLFDFNYEIALNKLKNKINCSSKEVVAELLSNNFADDFEKGLISSKDFYAKFKTKFDAQITYEEFVEIWCDIFSPNVEMIALAHALSLIYPIYLISNINELHFEYLFKKYPDAFMFFDKLILSFEVKSLKPEKAIYEELRKQSNRKYEDIIYIDDRHDLIHEAKKFNLSAIHFSTFDNLITELNSLNICLPDKKEFEALKYLKDKIKNRKNTLLVGIGNTLKSDDGAGVRIIQKIKEDTGLNTLDAGTVLESYLSKISNSGSDFVIFIDAAALNEEETFGCYETKDAQGISMFFTHDTSLKLITQYLQNQKSFDILILAIGARNFTFGETLSEGTKRAEILISSFFTKTFPAKNLGKD
ncbi:MAG: hydrogenase maturation protease [Candidatus Omnitrophota bacterium]|jgi:putative hydrolase of the HAD superfamily